jgi:hypothetical protein
MYIVVVVLQLVKFMICIVERSVVVSNLLHVILERQTERGMVV